MKKITLILSAILISVIANAQYSFSQFNAAYTPLSVANDQFGDIPDWDDDIINIPIGFPVTSFGKVYDSIAIESNGSLFLNNNFTNIDFWTATDTFVTLMPFGEFISQNGTGDLVSRDIAASPIIYELHGTAGNRIAKIEWQNAGFYNDPSGNFSDSVNFQCWIYEADGSIEFRYGTSQVSAGSLDGATGPTVGISHYYLNPDFAFASGTYLSGSPATASTATAYGQLNGIPPSTKVYRWSNLSIGVNEKIENVDFYVYPNPANDNVILTFNTKENVVLKINDLTGKVVYNETIQSNGLTKHAINTKELADGVYFVTLQTTQGLSTKKLVIKK
jgi:hypothetical protein